MNVQHQIADYIATQPERKRTDMLVLHGIIQALIPQGRLWFLDGKDENGRTISNPNIGYGSQTMAYADGSSRTFYQIGMSANTTGISVYIMGLQEKTHLVETYSQSIGKATVTGYCIKFRTLSNINVDVLRAAMHDGIEQSGGTA